MLYDDDPPRQRMQPGTKVALGFFVLCGFILILVSIPLIVLLASKGPVAAPQARAEKAAPTATKPDLVVDAQALFTAYTRNAPAADLVYNNKILEISGTIANTGSDKKGSYIIFAVVRWHPPGAVSLNEIHRRISASAASGIQGVRCYLRSSGEPPPQRGQTITLRGQCVGMPLDVEVRDCVIARP